MPNDEEVGGIEEEGDKVTRRAGHQEEKQILTKPYFYVGIHQSSLTLLGLLLEETSSLRTAVCHSCVAL
jgi:hypothetical protein